MKRGIETNTQDNQASEVQKLGNVLFAHQISTIYKSEIAERVTEVFVEQPVVEPSLPAKVPAEKTPNYRKKLVVGTGVATVAISALSIMNPSVAAFASESVSTAPNDLKAETDTTIKSSPSEKTSNGVKVQVAAPESSAEAPKESISVSSQATKPAPETIKVAVAEPDTSSTAEALSVSSTPVVETSAPVAKVSVSPPVQTTAPENTHEGSTDPTTPVTPDVEARESTITIGSTPVDTSVNVTTPVEVAPPTPELSEDNTPKPVEPIVIIAEPEIEVPTVDTETATPEQLAFQDISIAVQSNNIDAAVAILVDTFHNKAVSEKNEAIANPALVTKIKELRTQYQVTLGAGGHSDTTYVNTSLMNFVVAEALATDANLNSETLATLFNVKYESPKGEYEAKLFNKYVAKADEILKTNDSELLKGLNDVNKAILEKVYPHLMVSTLSETSQAEAIQTIKDDEAAEAKRKADEKAKAEREAKEKADRERENADVETLVKNPEKLIKATVERAAEKYNWPKRKTYFFRALAELGVDIVPMAGLGGNVQVESAGYNPNILERGWEHDPNRGLGLVQYTNYIWSGVKYDENGQAIGGRRTVYEAAARKAGFDPLNDTSYEFVKWQVKYIIDESKRRTQRDGSGNEWEGFISIKDAKKSADYFRWNFERPGTPHSVPRQKAAAQLYRQLDSALRSIKAEAKEAEQRQRNHSESESREIAEHGPTFKQALEMAEGFFNNRDKYLINMKAPKNRVQCTTLVNYFTRRYVSGSGQEGHGYAVAKIFAERNDNSYSLTSASDIEPFTIFSLKGNHWNADPGHTGMIMSVDPDGSIIVVEANVQERIRNASGMLDFESFGNKRRENWRIGQVNVERWSSIDAWKRHWAKWGYTDPTFASPDNPEQIAKNFEKGSR